MTEKPAEAVRAEVQQRLREIELYRREARDLGLSFSALSEEQLTGKARVAATGTPYIYAQAWTSGTTPGSPASYRVYVSNPDPGGYYPVFLSVFFGLANFLAPQAFGEAAARGNFNGGTPWPYLSSRPISLASGATANELFSYTVPAGAVPTTYLGNAVLWRAEYHDQGAYFDRGFFSVTVS